MYLYMLILHIYVCVKQMFAFISSYTLKLCSIYISHHLCLVQVQYERTNFYLHIDIDMPSRYIYTCMCVNVLMYLGCIFTINIMTQFALQMERWSLDVLFTFTLLLYYFRCLQTVTITTGRIITGLVEKKNTLIIVTYLKVYDLKYYIMKIVPYVSE